MSFFKKRNKGNNIHSVEISDWMLNIRDKCLELGISIVEDDPGNIKILAYFNLAMSSNGTANIIHLNPDIKQYTSLVLSELIMYYNCLWFNILVKKAKSEVEIDKLRKIYPIVEINELKMLRGIFEDNKKIEELLKIVTNIFNKEYTTVSTAIYIGDDLEKTKVWINNKEVEKMVQEMKDGGDVLGGNMIIVCSRISNIFNKIKLEIDADKLVSMINEDFEKTLKLKLLTRFDVNKAITLPDTFFEDRNE